VHSPADNLFLPSRGSAKETEVAGADQLSKVICDSDSTGALKAREVEKVSQGCPFNRKVSQGCPFNRTG
jgi:hypothetical protein